MRGRSLSRSAGPCHVRRRGPGPDRTGGRCPLSGRFRTTPTTPAASEPVPKLLPQPSVACGISGQSPQRPAGARLPAWTAARVPQSRRPARGMRGWANAPAIHSTGGPARACCRDRRSTDQWESVGHVGPPRRVGASPTALTQVEPVVDGGEEVRVGPLRTGGHRAWQVAVKPRPHLVPAPQWTPSIATGDRIRETTRAPVTPHERAHTLAAATGPLRDLGTGQPLVLVLDPQHPHR